MLRLIDQQIHKSPNRRKKSVLVLEMIYSSIQPLKPIVINKKKYSMKTQCWNWNSKTNIFQKIQRNLQTEIFPVQTSQLRNVIAVTSHGCLKSKTIWLFIQQLVQADIKENSKAPHHWTFVKPIHRWWIASNANNVFMPMTQCKTAVTPLLTHWSYCSLALSHQYHDNTNTSHTSLPLIHVHQALPPM